MTAMTRSSKAGLPTSARVSRASAAISSTIWRRSAAKSSTAPARPAPRVTRSAAAMHRTVEVAIAAPSSVRQAGLRGKGHDPGEPAPGARVVGHDAQPALDLRAPEHVVLVAVLQL